MRIPLALRRNFEAYGRSSRPEFSWLADSRDLEPYTTNPRSQHLTQADPRMFGQSYIANRSSVEGQAAYLGDHRHVDYFQSLEKFREQGLLYELPAHLAESLGGDSRLVELESEVQALAGKGGATTALREAKSRRDGYRKSLKRAAFRQHQEKWICERRDWKILTRGKERSGDTYKTDLVQSLCLLIPE